MTFKDFNLVEPILRALKEQGYANPTPIQEQSIPILLKGKDLLGCAQTGTGKTAAFTIPIIQNMYENNKYNGPGRRRIKALIVTPTRELAIQIAENITNYAKYVGLKNTVIFGGVKQGSQVRTLDRGVDILVATPGRLLDLIGQGHITLRYIKYFVLDEADHMLDMGFIHDIKKVIALLPEERQSLFFSATMPKSIVELADRILGNPEKVTVRPQQATAERVEQALYYVMKQDKPSLLIHLIQTKEPKSVLVFSRTKHGADKIVRLLAKKNLNAAAIHGNKSQNNRQKALKAFKEGQIKILVATDIAARGIDVSQLELVINYDLPNIPETYVHRIGRTGRASASGIAVSFCMGEERPYLKDIQRLIKQDLPVVDDHPFVDDREDSEIVIEKKPQGGRRGGRPGGNRNNSGPSKKKRGGNRWGNNRNKKRRSE